MAANLHTPPGALPDDHFRALREASDAHAFLKQWLELAVQRLPRVGGALLLVEGESGTLVPGATWPGPIADVAPYAHAAQLCVDRQAEVILPVEASAGDTVVACPVLGGTRLIGALVLIARDINAEDVAHAVTDIHWGAGWLDALLRSRGREAESAALQRARPALDLIALVAQFEHVEDACMAVAAELARSVGGLRVAIGLVGQRNSRVRVVALSHAAWFDRRSQQAAAIERAMDEAVEQRSSLSWPAAHDDPMRVDRAQHDLAVAMPAADGAVSGVLTVPIVAGARAVGAVVWHLPAQQLTPGFLAQVEGIAVVLAPMLARLQDESRWFSGAVPAAVRRGWTMLSDPRRPAFAVAATLVVATLAAAALVPVNYNVPARAVLEGEVQRVLPAPFEGFIAAAPARAGQHVTRGQLLARLEDRELVIEQTRLKAEQAQTESKLAEAVARHERPEAAVLEAQLGEVDARLAQVSQRLQRTRVEAPFDAMVVSGDWSQAIGSPVEQGATLFTVAPLTGYRVVLKVDERDVGAIKPGQRGELVLASLVGNRHSFTVAQISSAVAEDGANLFRVEANLDGAPSDLRPGMEGVGRILAGERTLLWITTHRFVDWLRIAWWRAKP